MKTQTCSWKKKYETILDSLPPPKTQKYTITCERCDVSKEYALLSDRGPCFLNSRSFIWQQENIFKCVECGAIAIGTRFHHQE